MIWINVIVVPYRMDNDTRNDAAKSKVAVTEALPSWLQLVRDQVRSLKFGTVQITVHDSRVVQVERVEKQRFDRTEKSDS